MSLLLKILPIFPLVDKDFVIETVTNSENSGLFDWVVIEYCYRAIIEIVLFHILCHFRHKTKKSVNDIVKRIAITVGLVLWNYIGLSINVFRVEPSFNNLIRSLYYTLVLPLFYFSFNLCIAWINAQPAAKFYYPNKEQDKFYLNPIQQLKSFIDGDYFFINFLGLFFNGLLNHKTFLLDQEFRLFSFGGFFLKTYFLVKWNIHYFSMPMFIAMIAFGFYFRVYLKEDVYRKILKLFAGVKEQFSKPTNNYRMSEYLRYTKFILLWSCIIDIALVIIYAVNFPYKEDGFNLLIAMNKLFDKGTLPLVCISIVSYNVSRGKTDLSFSYLLYGYDEEEELQEQEDLEKQELEKREIDDKDFSSAQ